MNWKDILFSLYYRTSFFLFLYITRFFAENVDKPRLETGEKKLSREDCFVAARTSRFFNKSIDIWMSFDTLHCFLLSFVDSCNKYLQ